MKDRENLADRTKEYQIAYLSIFDRVNKLLAKEFEFWSHPEISVLPDDSFYLHGKKCSRETIVEFIDTLRENGDGSENV